MWPTRPTHSAFRTLKQPFLEKNISLPSEPINNVFLFSNQEIHCLYGMPTDHVSLLIPQSKLDDVISFLTTSMSHMGFRERWRPISTVVGLGDECYPDFWVAGVNAEDEGWDEKTIMGILKGGHYAFTAKSRSFSLLRNLSRFVNFRASHSQLPLPTHRPKSYSTILLISQTENKSTPFMRLLSRQVGQAMGFRASESIIIRVTMRLS